jgi:hypothetical protein
LGYQAIRAGHEVRFAKTSRILADLADATCAKCVCLRETLADRRIV